MEQGLTAFLATGTLADQPYWGCLRAEVYSEANRVDEALNVLEEALRAANQYGDRHYEAEIHRLKGELLLRQDNQQTHQAEECFRRAIVIAHKQGSRSFELRATTRLARLLSTTGRREEARMVLAEIYGWFTEGFDTADLKDAKALLDELADS
jgi:predicted ATPase